jgi:hypothetical protein
MYPPQFMNDGIKSMEKSFTSLYTCMYYVSMNWGRETNILGMSHTSWFTPSPCNKIFNIGQKNISGFVLLYLHSEE